MDYKKQIAQKQIAQTILQQLNGSKFLAMTGAKNLGYGENYLSFKIGRNASKCNHIKIVLNDLDLYDMHFIRIRKGQIIKDDVVKNLYHDMLQKVFTEQTGLYTSL